MSEEQKSQEQQKPQASCEGEMPKTEAPSSVPSSIVLKTGYVTDSMPKELLEILRNEKKE
jgi:hypothetical protein